MVSGAPASEQTRTGRARLVIGLKVAVTLALCGFLVLKADWNGVLSALRQIDMGLVLAVFVLMMLSVTISAYKWKLLLAIHSADYRFSLLHRYYFIAVFFNNFLPTSIGGDGYRVYKTLNNSRSRSAAVIAVFVERLTGIAALLVIGYVCAILVHGDRQDALSRWIVAVGSIGLAAGITMVLLLWKTGWLRRLLTSRRMPKVIGSVAEHLRDYAHQPARSANAILVSFLFQIHNGIAFYLLLVYGVDAPITIPEIFVVLTLINVISILPISINGIGVVDGSFIYLAGLYAVPYDAALAVMLINRALLVVISIIGAVLYFRD